MSRLKRSGIFALIFSALLAAGCAHKPKNITDLPHGSAPAPTPPPDYGATQPPIRPNPNNAGNTGTGVGPGNVFNPRDNTHANDLGGQNNPGNQQVVVPAPIDTTAQDPSLGQRPPPGVEDRETLKGDTVYFDYDKSAIKNSEYAKVGAVAEYIKGHPESNLIVEGHCDERGTEEYNRALGERRALAIRERLVNLGVRSDKITTISYGKDRPVPGAEGHNDDSWSKNRRGEFVIEAQSPSLK